VGVDVTIRQRLAKSPMTENHPWQQRTRAAGLTQRVLARLLGYTDATVSSQLRGHREGGVPRHVVAVIVMWEMLTPEQRDRVVAAVDSEFGSRSPGTDPDSGGAAESNRIRALEKQVKELTRRLEKAERER